MQANYKIERREPGALYIRDVGPWDRFMTVTNNAHEVLQHLIDVGDMRPDERLFYYDSEGELTEIDHTNGSFNRFKFVKPTPR